MQNLNLSGNDLSGPQFSSVCNLLISNKRLRHLSLADCNLETLAADTIGTGMSKNTALHLLDISDNKFGGDAFKQWPQKCLKGLRTLRTLDVSKNPWLGAHDIYNLPLCFKNQTKVLQGETSNSLQVKQPQLTELNLKDTNMSRNAGIYLSQLLAGNTTINKIQLDFNPDV